MLLRSLLGVAGAAAFLCACSSDPHVAQTTTGGAAIGAVAGAVIGNNTGARNPASGAFIGAVAGGAIGAIKGCRDEGGCGASGNAHRRYYDEHAGRYYYYDTASGRYFWEDGRPRAGA